MIVLENRYSMLWTFLYFVLHAVLLTSPPHPHAVSHPSASRPARGVRVLRPYHRAESDGFQSSFEVDSSLTMFSEKHKNGPGARWRCAQHRSRNTYVSSELCNWSCEYRRTCGGRDPRPSAIRRVPALRTGNLPCLRCGDFGARLGGLGCPRCARARCRQRQGRASGLLADAV